MRIIALLLFVASLCFGQISKTDRFSANFREFSGVMHGTATVSGNVTTNGTGVMTVNTTAAHGLAAGDRIQLASCASTGLNGWWPVATVPTNTSLTVTGTEVNNANSASCVLTTYKRIVSRTFYVAGLVLMNNSTSAVTVNVLDLSTTCSGPCRVGVPLNLSVSASTVSVISFPYITASGGVMVSASDGTNLQYRLVGSY